MSRSIDLYSYDYEKLLNKVIEHCNTDNKELAEKILLACGNKIADRYILLNQEFWEDYSCYYNVASVLDNVFNVEDSFGEIFCTFRNSPADRQGLISAISRDGIYREIGLREEKL